VPLLHGICASYRMRILSEVASCSGPDNHGNSVTELTERRFGTRTGNPGRRERLRVNNASNLTRNNKDCILRLLQFVQALIINGHYALATEPLGRPSRLDVNSSWRPEFYPTRSDAVQEKQKSELTPRRRSSRCE